MIIKINRKLSLNTKLKYHQDIYFTDKHQNPMNYNFFKYKNFKNKNMTLH